MHEPMLLEISQSAVRRIRSSEREVLITNVRARPVAPALRFVPNKLVMLNRFVPNKLVMLGER